MTTARGFEPLRAEPNGFLVHHLSHSVTLSINIEAVIWQHDCRPCSRLSRTWIKSCCDSLCPILYIDQAAEMHCHEFGPWPFAWKVRISKKYTNNILAAMHLKTRSAGLCIGARKCRRAAFLLLLAHAHSAAKLKIDTCGIRAHAGRPHRLSRPTP